MFVVQIGRMTCALFGERLTRDWTGYHPLRLTELLPADTPDPRWDIAWQGIPIARITAFTTGTDIITVRAWQWAAVKTDGIDIDVIRAFAAWTHLLFADQCTILQDDAGAEPASAAPGIASAAGDERVTKTEPAGQLTEAEQKWYQTFLTCKQAYGNRIMTWRDIADRHGVSGRTAKRRLQELQARQLPGLDDWPDRHN